MHARSIVLAAATFGATGPAALAQPGGAPPPAAAAAPARPKPIVSPQVAPDRRVTFRLRAPRAKEVRLAGQWSKDKPTLARDGDGIWTLTVGPVDPGVYEYSFEVDGLSVVDPANPHIKPQRAPSKSILEVPGSPPLLTEFQEVPHGTLHVHHYLSKVTGTVRRAHVYTPPGYETRPGVRYPTLYLLHGRGDNDAAWSAHGRAHFVLDNLIARKQAVPMLVVMTDGHPLPEGAEGGDVIARFKDNTGAYKADLFQEVMPLVESLYRVRRDVAGRAIVGLSMGGHQALTIGLHHPERFAWVAGFSAAAPPAEELEGALADPKTVARKLRWLWIGCGKDDFLLERNQALVALLTQKGVPHVWRLTEGGHSWPVWRGYLAEVVPLLFAARR